MVIAAALLVIFSVAGGFGVVFNNTAAVVVGWVGFAVSVLVFYWTAPAGPNGRARFRSRERG
ncbi:MAG: hypothetical protein ACJ73V_09165 [Acidimicrobiia bacterium]